MLQDISSKGQGLTDSKRDDSNKLREKLETLKEKNLLLEERLQLQKTSWLYSHHLSLSICFGVIYGGIIGILSYCMMYLLDVSGPIYESHEDVSLVLGLLVIFGIPTIAVLVPIIFFKAPRFALYTLGTYSVSFLFFNSLILYVDPLHFLLQQYQEVSRLQSILAMTATQFLVVVLTITFVPQIAKKCGYRLVLDGSTFSFEVDADITTVSEQLNKLEEDFNLVPDKLSNEPNTLHFMKKYGGKNLVLQFFLHAIEHKTNVVLVMHSIKNDVPMRTGRDEIERIGKTLMRWLEVSRGFTVLPAGNEHLINEMVPKSVKSFYRQPVALPSIKVIWKFLRAHWKDVLIILGFLIAVLSWLLPIK